MKRTVHWLTNYEAADDPESKLSLIAMTRSRLSLMTKKRAMTCTPNRSKLFDEKAVCKGTRFPWNQSAIGSAVP